MKYICLYLHVHQPFRIRNYNIFDIGNYSNYFENDAAGIYSNREVFYKIAKKSYYPLNRILLNLLKNNPHFKVNFSITGTILEQMLKFDTNVLSSFKDLVKTKKVEILSETYYHSLASLYAKQEFIRQVNMHAKAIKDVFGLTTRFFRNTELIFSNYISQIVEDMGFDGMITEGTEKILHWRSPNYLYKTNTKKGINLMLKNYKLSDDMAFRFGEKTWVEYPLNAEKYLYWLDNTPGEVINLFMDYETFGEHQWEDTGIFNFFEDFINRALGRGYKFINFKDINKLLKPCDRIDCPFIVSWADIERDTSAWTENPMQQDVLHKIYDLEEELLSSCEDSLIKDWRYLQISDHFYYMCTKWFNDGDVHAYFSPYKSPYEAYNNYNNVLIDLKQRFSAVKKYAKVKV